MAVKKVVPAIPKGTTSAEGRKVTPVKKTTVVKAETVVAKPVVKKAASLKADVLDLKGKVIETITLSDAIFGASVNKTLMAQAVRVYLANQRVGTASTKTRGEVRGSTRKIYQQKGTGRARHGGIRAPIFVGGGIAFGPKPRDYSLNMPQKMRQRALISALTTKQQDGSIKIVSGFEKITPKTKEFVQALENLSLNVAKKKILLVLPAKTEDVQRAARNVEGVHYMLANQLNTYEVLNNKTILFMKDALDTLEKTVSKGDK